TRLHRYDSTFATFFGRDDNRHRGQLHDGLFQNGTGIIVGRLRRCQAKGGDLPGVVSTPAKLEAITGLDRKSTRLNSSHVSISYAVFCSKKKQDTETFPP